MKSIMLNLLLLTSLPALANPNSIEKHAREKKLEAALNSFPPMKEHHESMKELLKTKLNPEAVVIVENVVRAGILIEQKDKDQALKTINYAIQVAEKAKSQMGNEDLMMVEYNVDVINEAPYDIKEIKVIKKDITQAFRLENFPKTRDLLASLVSELHMQSFYISLNNYLGTLNQLKTVVAEKQFSEAQNSVNQLLGTVTAEDWGVPLPYIEAQSALIAADTLKETNLKQAKINITEAQYQLDRAMALGYVTGEEADFKMLNDKLKMIKKDMFRKQFKVPDFQIIKGELIAFIKKQMAPKNQKGRTQMSLLKKNK